MKSASDLGGLGATQSTRGVAFRNLALVLTVRPSYASGLIGISAGITRGILYYLNKLY